ncbi:hypothetical protein Lal_00000946 [Lupinus albus]|nr:hypothetical protein Lal_00000946 [Lupinus albus]
MVRGKLITLDEDLFLEVGRLSNDGSPLGDYENELWNSFDPMDMYKSFLHVGSLIVESRLLHYLIVYILVQRNTNHAQPTINDLKLILLAYKIFISRVIDYLEIDTSDFEVIVINSREHLIVDKLIHKMGIYKCDDIWMYLENQNIIMDI